MKKILGIIVFIMLVSSCKKKEDLKSSHYNKEGFKIIKINEENKVESLNISEFINKIEYIPLETLPTSIIGSVSKVIVDDQYIYVLDNRVVNALFVFDKNGKYIKKMGDVGNGPGEYQDVSDFSLLKNNRVMLYDYAKKRINYFENLNFSHYKEIDWYNNLITKKDSFYYFVPHKNYSGLPKKNADADLLITDNKFQLLKKEFLYESNNIISGDNIDFSFYRDSLTIVRKEQNKIYRIKGTKLEPKYYLDFADKNFPYELTVSEEVRTEKEYEYALMKSPLIESDNYIYFQGTYGSNELINYLYSKKSNTIKFSNRLINDLDGLFAFNLINAGDQCFYGIIKPEVLDRIKGLDKEVIGLTNIKELDNPILAIYHYK